jgi:Bacterial SH3 domain
MIVRRRPWPGSASAANPRWGGRMQGRTGLVIALMGHALAVALLVLAAILGGVSAAVRLAVATPTPTPTLHPVLARPVLPPPPTAAPSATPAPIALLVSRAPEPTATPTAAVAPSPTLLPRTAVDAGGRGARLREGPGLGAAILGVLPERMPVAVLGPEAEEDGRAWRRVRIPDGLEGWVDADLLAPIDLPVPAASTPTWQPLAAERPGAE